MAEDEAPAEEKSAGGGKKTLLLVVVGIVLIGLSVGGTLMALKFFAPEPPPAVVEGQEGVVEEAVEEEKNPAIYYPIKPPIIVNYQARGRQRFLQVEVTLMTRKDEVIRAVELHMPMIRNSLVLLFGGQIYEDIQTAEGKEYLRQQALLELQGLMEQEIGQPGIEQVLFTNFVMQ